MEDKQFTELLRMQQQQFEQLLKVFTRTMLKAFGKTSQELEAAELAEPLAVPGAAPGVVADMPPRAVADKPGVAMPLPERLTSQAPRVEIDVVAPGERVDVPRMELPSTPAERRAEVERRSAEERDARRERLGKPDDDLPMFREERWMHEPVFKPPPVPKVIPDELPEPEVPSPLPEMVMPVTVPPPVLKPLEIPLPRRDHAQEGRANDADSLGAFDYTARERLIDYQHEQALSSYRIMRRQVEMMQQVAHDLSQLQQQADSMTDAYMTDPTAFHDIG
jgi:hypothetical protein